MGIFKPLSGKMILESFSNQLNDPHANYVCDFNITPKDFRLHYFCNTHNSD